MTIAVGSRVQINPAEAASYSSKWRQRIAKGLFGTVESKTPFGWHVQLDMPPRAKYDDEWHWNDVRTRDLIEVQP